MNIENERKRNAFFSAVHGLVSRDHWKEIDWKKAFHYSLLIIVCRLLSLRSRNQSNGMFQTKDKAIKFRTGSIFSTGESSMETSLLLKCTDAKVVGRNGDNPVSRVQVDLSLPCTEYASETNKEKRVKLLKRKQRRMKHNIVRKKTRERKGKWDYTRDREMTVSACYKLLHGSEPIITTENERTFWLNRDEQLTSSYSFAWNILLSLSLTFPLALRPSRSVIVVVIVRTGGCFRFRGTLLLFLSHSMTAVLFRCGYCRGARHGWAISILTRCARGRIRWCWWIGELIRYGISTGIGIAFT